MGIRESDILKPCPFCGCVIGSNQPFMSDLGTGEDCYVIQCDECHGMYYDRDKDEAIRGWNRRVGE